MHEAITNLDDASAYYGLSHAADRAEEYTVDDRYWRGTSSADYGEPLLPAIFANPLLADTAWNDHFNRKIEAQGGMLPPKVILDADGRVVGLEDRDIEDQRKTEFERLSKERPGTPYPDLYSEAKRIVAARQSPVHRNQGAYDDVRAEARIVALERPDLSFKDQTREAFARVTQRHEGRIDRMDGGKKRSTVDEYLGDTLENLMRPSTEIEQHGSRRGRARESRKPGVDSQALYDHLLGEAT